MKYRFDLFDKNTNNQGWWLKIETEEQLSSYIFSEKKFGLNQQYARAYRNYLTDKRYQSDSVIHGPYLAEAPLTEFIALRGQNQNCSFLSHLAETKNEQITNMQQFLSEYGYIHINRAGGFCIHTGKPDAVLYQNSLSFPQFSSDDIRIRQFPGGKHYYAYVGTMQVKDGEKQKWDSYQEAYEQAKQFITE